MPSSSEYNRKYYLENKERIARRKSERYRNDPEYRAAIKAGRERQREREKAARGRKKAVPHQQKPGKRMRIILPDGTRRVVSMFSLGQFAYRVGVSAQTVRKWESDGILPAAIYRSKGGHRLYTEDQVNETRRVFQYHRGRMDAWRLTDEFQKDMSEAWASLVGGVRRTLEE